MLLPLSCVRQISPTSITTPAYHDRENFEMWAFRSSVFYREEGASLGASSSLQKAMKCKGLLVWGVNE